MSIRPILPFLILFLPLFIFSQSVSDYTVQVSAVVNNNPPSITLNWEADANSNQYQVFRKLKGSNNWGFILASLSGSAISWMDTNVAIGSDYEYRIYKSTSGYQGFGYIYAGLENEMQDYYGTVILLVDSSQAQGIAAELNQYEEDLIGDGWKIIKHEISPNAAVTDVKAVIQADYNANPSDVKAVILLGHIPVPYSGNIFPDGHTNHRGAWPADVYYGDMNGTWTDFTVSETSASRTENHNIPGDGKFDQSIIPSNVELYVGRVDFSKMPAFSASETDLLNRYLRKNHAFRQHEFAPPEKAVIDDNFGVFNGEIFAGNGWRNFAPLVHPANVSAGDFRTSLNSSPHLWAYGCGGGSYSSANGIGSTNDFAGDSLLGVFSLIFGSYHGDWDSQNNFLRATLAAKGNILTCAWAGRPHWQFHHMGLGQPIGYSAMNTQNNSNTYFSSYFPRYVHIALMGDPTLRMHIVAPPTNLTVIPNANGRYLQLDWTSSPDTVIGYHIFQADSLHGTFSRITSQPISATSWVDSCPLVGNSIYMVRALKLETGHSGSYYNLSQGIFTNANTSGSLTVQTLSNPGPYCAGNSIGLVYQASGSVCPGNTFYMELSDATGSFANPDTIGSTQDSSSVNQLFGVLPNTTPAGTGYRVRIVSDLPTYVSNDNGSPFTIEPLPQAIFTSNLVGNTLNLSNSSLNANSFAWNFGDGDTDTSSNPTHSFVNPGSFTVVLIAMNSCGNDTAFEVITLVGISEQLQKTAMTVYPNPSQGLIRIQAEAQPGEVGVLTVLNLNGQKIREIKVDSGQDGFSFEINLQSLSKGIYTLQLLSQNGLQIAKIILD